MTTTTIRAEELCGKHRGMYLDGQEIVSVVQDETTDVYDARRKIARFDPDDKVTLSDVPVPQLPTEPGSLIAATDARGDRLVRFRDVSGAWRDKFSYGPLGEKLSDPVELVAVPKKEYEKLARQANTDTGVSIIEAAHRLVIEVEDLNAGLSS